jgi:hypothetical protein
VATRFFHFKACDICNDCIEVTPEEEVRFYLAEFVGFMAKRAEISRVLSKVKMTALRELKSIRANRMFAIWYRI